MKKFGILFGLMTFPIATFAGGYGLSTPIKLDNVAVEKPVEKKIVRNYSKEISQNSDCGTYRDSRWYECDTKSVLQKRRSLLSERFSDSQRPTVGNRTTRGKDIEREYDRQAAARNKLLRYRRAFGQ